MHLFKILLFCLLPMFLIAQEKTIDVSTKRSITLQFVGDIMGHQPQINSAKTADGEYDYEPCFRYVKPIIESADLAIANLELTLPGKGPYTGYPRFRSPDDLALALKDAGFDLIVTANNHSNDDGKRGVINTISTLESYGFWQTGTFRSQEDKDIYYPLIVYKNDFKLIFLNYTYGTNGLKTKSPTVVNLIEEDKIKADIEEAKQYAADAIFVIMHWGGEYQLKENKKQRALANKMLKWGADHIIGAHPHVVQPIYSKYDSTNQKEHLMAYSLGNFISNQKYEHTDGGIILELKLEKDLEAQGIKIKSSEYIPVYRYRHKEKKKTTFFVLPISPFENGEIKALEIPKTDLESMTSFRKKLNVRLKKNGATEKIITDYQTK